jgi:hypothetical protein
MKNSLKSDRDFLGYVYLHSQTELALFHKDHINRLLKLAGKEELQEPCPSFMGVHYDVAKPLIEAARKNG